ncbi:hypothetical protein HDU93_008389 [Gonapodya sp. JEL0774]|nr:hypothetical protein HDU93_008389 [Gonapodya sp. JEL0774]
MLNANESGTIASDNGHPLATVVEKYHSYLSLRAKGLRNEPILSVMKDAMEGIQSSSTDVIHLAGGNPNPETFGIRGLHVEMADGRTVKIEGDLIREACDYGLPYGLPALKDWCHILTSHVHGLPRDAFQTSIATGNLGTTYFIFDLTCDRGDFVLTDSPTFTGALTPLKPLGVTPCPVATDAQGVMPESLEQILADWDDKLGKRPNVFYTVPTGGNPTGATTSEDRKRKILEVCGKYKVMIIEDDPYYFLQFTPTRVPSYLSLLHSHNLDVAPPVIRLDSFAKVFCAGARVSWVSGPPDLMKLLDLTHMASIGHGSLLAQAIILATVSEMGLQGFIKNAEWIRDFYLERRNFCVALAEKHLSRTCTWEVPSAGMFLWVKVLKGSPTDTRVDKLTGESYVDATQLVLKQCIPTGLLIVPGGEFFPKSQMGNCPYLRISYSMAGRDELERGMARLGGILDMNAGFLNDEL